MKIRFWFLFSCLLLICCLFFLFNFNNSPFFFLLIFIFALKKLINLKIWIFWELQLSLKWLIYFPFSNAYWFELIQIFDLMHNVKLSNLVHKLRCKFATLFCFLCPSLVICQKRKINQRILNIYMARFHIKKTRQGKTSAWLVKCFFNPHVILTLKLLPVRIYLCAGNSWLILLFHHRDWRLILFVFIQRWPTLIRWSNHKISPFIVLKIHLCCPFTRTVYNCESWNVHIAWSQIFLNILTQFLIG